MGLRGSADRGRLQRLVLEQEPQPDVTGVGTPVGSAVTASVGPQGGTLTSADGRFRLDVPAGVLGSTETLTAQAITNLAPAGFGTAVRLGPEGTTFKSPVTLTFLADDADFANTSIQGIGLAFQDDQRLWEWMPGATFDAAARTVSVPTTHLSDWSRVEGAQLSPSDATVKAGDSLGIDVVWCYGQGAPGDLTFGYECDAPAPLTGKAKGWSVDAKAGGSATLGTIAGDGFAATYTAPSTPPSPSTVAVSMVVSGSSGVANNGILVSYITIVGAAGDLAGTFGIDWTSLGVTVHLDANATLTVIDDGNTETNYKFGGTVKITKSFSYNGITCTIDEPTRALGPQGLFKVLKQPKPAVRWGFADLYTYTCQVSGTTFTLAVYVNFATLKGPDCGQEADPSIANVGAPKGSFTETCAPGQTGVATWSFGPK